MRMLPAQFTDVATQLAGGQSPWLILLQQGAGEGLLRRDDPHVQGLAGAITLPMVGATSLAVATGRWRMRYQGNSTLSDFNKNAGPFRQSGGTDGRSYAGPVQIRAGGRADV
ncbi:phage tail length tape measure family protein [Escherichia coli]|uniref:phage tail length tape measure family protein n=1 Tax=Escherichia coli TaxID=562 RepID=UPI001A11E907|nr:hypothetical protein ECZU12_49110 [Escherichia coli]